MTLLRRLAPAAAAVAASAAASCLSAAELKSSSAEKPKKPADPKSVGELVATLAVRGRHVFLSGPIDDESAKGVIAQLIYLEQEAPGQTISLHINSGGGKVQAGLAIHDVMKSLTSPVHTTCLGHCESMAAVLLAAGAPGGRAAMPNARVMIHQPVRTGGGGVGNNARQLSIHAASIEASRRRLAELLARYTGRPLDEISAVIEYDHVCDAHGALAFGLVDRVLGAVGEFPPTRPRPAEREAPPAVPADAPESS